MDWDTKHDLVAAISMYISLEWFKEVIHDDEDVLNNGTKPNKVVNLAVVVMEPKAINYAAIAAFLWSDIGYSHTKLR
eukprot:7501379-Ditylum_brightwellii.AAC.1